MNWNDTWPDGSAIVPAPGMLVAYQQPGDDAVFWGIVADGADFVARFERDESDNYYPVDVIQGPHFTPLAPAPTPGGLWAALELLDTCPDHICGYEWHSFNLEAGYICWEDGKTPEYDASGPATSVNYEARMRDMQKYGTLLAYCAQPGWGVQP